MTNPVRVVHTIAGLSSAYGGPSRSVLELARALGDARRDAEVRVLTMQEAAAATASDIVAIPTAGWLSQRLRYHPAFETALTKITSGGGAVIHDHGLWLPTNHAAAVVAMATAVPRIVSPRGMLSDWARAHRRWRKAAAWFLYQRRDLVLATALQAASEQEALDFRRLGLRQPVAIVPNGVVFPPAMLRAQPVGRKRVVVLCRLHPVKGLADLLRAWAAVRPSDWELHIAGPDESGYGEILATLAKDLGISADVQFEGALSDADKWRFLASGQLFVLPSVSESFSLATAEALAVGVPVVTTVAVPWPWLETWGCGWRAPLGVAGLSEVLRIALATPLEQLGRMGQSGAGEVRKKFAWPAVAAAQWQVYDWLMGGPRPSCVATD